MLAGEAPQLGDSTVTGAIHSSPAHQPPAREPWHCVRCEDITRAAVAAAVVAEVAAVVRIAAVGKSAFLSLEEAERTEEKVGEK